MCPNLPYKAKLGFLISLLKVAGSRNSRCWEAWSRIAFPQWLSESSWKTGPSEGALLPQPLGDKWWGAVHAAGCLSQHDRLRCLLPGVYRLYALVLGGAWRGLCGCHSRNWERSRGQSSSRCEGAVGKQSPVDQGRHAGPEVPVKE